MKTLFALLNLDHPGLGAVKAAVARDDLAAAGEHLLAYYLGKRKERCLDFWDLSGPEDYSPMPWGRVHNPRQLWKNTPEHVLTGQLFASGHTFDFSRDADIDWCTMCGSGPTAASIHTPRREHCCAGSTGCGRSTSATCAAMPRPRRRRRRSSRG